MKQIKTPRKSYTVNVQFKCDKCGELHYALESGLQYKAETPYEAACKAHEWLRGGGSYHDIWPMARRRDIVFRVKERGTPKGEGITLVEQTKFLNA